MSPLATCFNPSSSAIGPACVPFPAPGAPMRIRCTVESPSSRSCYSYFFLPNEPSVVAHQQLRLELLDGIEHDAHHEVLAVAQTHATAVPDVEVAQEIL